jgi:K+-sensing histidine kinase KdpD
MKPDRMLALVCYLSLVSIFLCDRMTPTEINLPILYIAYILLSLWHPYTYFSLRLAGLATFFILADFVFYPDQGAHLPFVIFNRAITLALVWVSAFIVVERKKLARLKQKALEERDQAQKEVAELVNLLPMCAWCKKVRDDDGYWEGIESYLVKHETTITHGICPECSQKINQEIKNLHALPPETTPVSDSPKGK